MSSESKNLLVDDSNTVDGSLALKQVSQKCGHCGKTFSRFSNLSRHVMVSHSGKRFPCSTCGQKFTCKEGLMRHVRIVHEKLRCEICFMIFNSVCAKDSHDCSGERLSLNSVSCSVCGKTFSCQSNLNKHKQVAHLGKTFPCNICFKVLRSRESMVEHSRSAHGLFLCSKCGVTFYLEEEFAQHVKVEHHFHISQDVDDENQRQANGEKNLFKTMRQRLPVSCDCCGKVFSSKSNLTKHIRTVHNKKEILKFQELQASCDERLECKIANFSQPTLFECALCSLKFRQRQSLGKHQQVVHNRLVTDGGCQCEICGKTFLYECNLKRHVKRHHERQRFTCHTCNIQFMNKNVAEEHYLLEHRDSEFSCSECMGFFTSAYKLHEHMRLSHSTLVNICSISKRL